MTSFIHPPCISAHIIHHTPAGPRYLLIRRSCGGYLHGTWQMVTGGIDEGETAIQAAFREIEEETGCIPTKLYSADAVETFFIHSQNKIVLVPVFVAFVENMDVRLCPEEHDAYEWLPFEEAQKRLVWAEQRRVLAHVHEIFGTAEPSPMLLIEKPAPVPSSKPMISRTGVYGIAMENKKLLVVRQSKGPHAGKWDLPGGGMEFGETVEEALRREFREEVGMTFHTMQFFANATAFTEAQDHSYVLYQVGLIYKLSGLSLVENLVAEMEHAWIDLEHLKSEEISPFVAQVLNLDRKIT